MQHDASGRKGDTGRLIFLLGPSGAGKDSLIDAARPQLLAAGVQIARRVITRSAEAKGEAAEGVSTERFRQLREQGAFAMHWHANGLDYGIAVQVDTWLAEGHSVLVNGSRAYLPQALQRYPDLLAVALQVSPTVLRQRLLARGRETSEQIDQRLARNDQLQTPQAPPGVVRPLDNSGQLADTVTRFIALLRQEKLITP
ncbi:phosphonate metabolism protein/1,5-bisphosphokinase (PRPP-forming) PhnN [Pseudomonas sp.]|uniref:phosphonate metabolism protein/1,5-bisphosphokinase (PRPP-forming) PhnN n=1 Tax=Pseudomonas sp. TaxID=306 RepID=UPI0028B08668|nr:phosphonate metabolism protein/1,5-bisphosphokinase (PRPP-forming) PhnN [Pseudomonas sp.]